MYQACDALWHAAVQVVLVLVLVLVLAGHTKLWLDSLSLFRSFSASVKSEIVVPSSTVPSRFVTPAEKAIDSVTDVLPVPLWPTMAMFRILSGE